MEKLKFENVSEEEIVKKELEGIIAGVNRKLDKEEDLVKLNNVQVSILDIARADLLSVEQGGDLKIGKNSKTVGYEDGKFYIFEKGGQRLEISLGQIMGGFVWGASYRPDTSVPKELRRKIVTERIKHELSSARDLFIAETESKSWFNQGGGQDEAYKKIFERLRNEQNQKFEELKAGELAELVVLSMITRLSHDYDLPFVIEGADPYSDVSHKIDFVIHIRTHRRGVGVESDERALGAQFTTATDAVTIQNKENQLRSAKKNVKYDERALRVEDIVLISVPVSGITKAVKDWVKESKLRKNPKNPDDYVNQETQSKIFEFILDKIPDNILSKSELAKYKSRIFDEKIHSKAA